MPTRIVGGPSIIAVFVSVTLTMFGLREFQAPVAASTVRGMATHTSGSVRDGIRFIATLLVGKGLPGPVNHEVSWERLLGRRGAPVAAWTVAKELGHSGTAMIEKTYGHLGEVRHRAETWSTESNSTPLS